MFGEYGYRVHPKLILTGIAEVELAHYVVETDAAHGTESEEGGGELVRDRAVLFAGVAEFALSHSWALQAGIGYELESHKDLFVVRGGVVFEIPMRDGMAVAIPLVVDYKEEFWAVSIAMSLSWSPEG